MCCVNIVHMVSSHVYTTDLSVLFHLVDAHMFCSHLVFPLSNVSEVLMGTYHFLPLSLWLMITNAFAVVLLLFFAEGARLCEKKPRHFNLHLVAGKCVNHSEWAPGHVLAKA